MSLLNTLTFIEKSVLDIPARAKSRREAVRRFLSFSKKAALASIPFAFGSVSKRAYAQSPNADAIEAVLQLALTLEYLEGEFYTLGLARAGLIPASALSAITTIRDHQNMHISFLKAGMEGLDIIPGNKPNFDFTGGKGTGQGAFPSVFSDYDTFLALAQTFEDTGVRAYKGQATELTGAGDILTAILNIHSVEARHASQIRQMRKARGVSIKPWITGKESGIGAAVQTSYDGEEADKQEGITITAINKLPISLEAASEAFDEPLTRTQLLEIIEPFIVL